MANSAITEHYREVTVVCSFIPFSPYTQHPNPGCDELPCLIGPRAPRLRLAKAEWQLCTNSNPNARCSETPRICGDLKAIKIKTLLYVHLWWDRDASIPSLLDGTHGITGRDRCFSIYHVPYRLGLVCFGEILPYLGNYYPYIGTRGKRRDERTTDVGFVCVDIFEIDEICSNVPNNTKGHGRRHIWSWWHFFLFIKGMRNNDFDDEIALFRNILRGRGTTFRAICVVVLMSGFGTFRLSIFFFLLAWCWRPKSNRDRISTK